MDRTRARVSHAHPRAHHEHAPAGLLHDPHRDERHGQVDERKQRRGELRVGDVGVAEHERRVVEDGVDAGELHTDLDDDPDHELLTEILRPEEVAARERGEGSEVREVRWSGVGTVAARERGEAREVRRARVVRWVR